MTPKPSVKLSSLRREAARDRDGDWQDAASIPGVRLKVRSIHFPPYTIARDLLMQKLRRQSGGKPIPQDTLVGELGSLYAEHLLLGWDGFDEAWTPDLAMEMLSDPLCSDLINAVEIAATIVGQAQLQFTDAAIKN
jgi:hypothetical protein